MNLATPEEAKRDLLLFEKEKGKDRAQLVERIFRLETNHFKSRQYQLTRCAGMEDGKWKNLPPASYTTVEMEDGHIKGRMCKFIKWNSVLDFCRYLSDYIDRHGGDYARWNSTDTERKLEYIQRVKSVKNRFIV